MNKVNTGFTLVELMVVVVIIGVLATLGFANFANSRELAMDREAQANLKLIASAEKMYRMELNTYVACANTTVINQVLRLMLPANNPTWRYRVRGVSATTFLATAQRVSGIHQNKNYTINQAQEDPVTPGIY